MMIAVNYFSIKFIRPSLPSVHPIYYSTHDIVVTSLITTSLLPFIVITVASMSKHWLVPLRFDLGQFGRGSLSSSTIFLHKALCKDRSREIYKKNWCIYVLFVKEIVSSVYCTLK